MLNEKSVIRVIFNRKKYIEYEVPDEGVMFYSEIEEKTYFLNFMTISIMDFCNGMNIGEIVSHIQNNFDVVDVTETELFNDIYEVCNNLLDNNFIEISKGSE